MYAKTMYKHMPNYRLQTADVVILCCVTDIYEFEDEFEDHEEEESGSDDEDDLLKQVPPDIVEESR